jgi:Cd2+/Zn2+-exporting ATPase
MEIQSSLTALGLTEYEARVYLALLKEYPANGYQISKRTGVPRSMVYEALGRLHNRGLALKSGAERAVYYRPLPPEQLLERFDREHKNLIAGLRGDLLSLYDVKPENSLWTVSGRDSVIAYASQMITNSENEAYLVVNDIALDHLRETIVSICARGVDVSVILTGEGTLDCEQVYYHPQAESDLQGLGDMLVVVVDNHECLIANMNADSHATVTKNMNLVLITRQFVWMELFAQKMINQLNPADLLKLDAADRRIYQNFSNRG